MDFNFYEYKQILSSVLKAGYSFSDYFSYKKVEKPCILRHDIDLSLKKAARFAEYEANLFENVKVSSTYFVLLSTSFYNVFIRENRDFLKRIISAGHTIGLHFDETQYDINGNIDLFKEKVLDEINILSNVIESPIETFSMHRPSPQIIEKDVEIPGIVNSYSKVFFNDFKYISDSRMNWRENPFNVVDSKRYDKLHILTHPFWYDGGGLKQQLIRFIETASLERYDYLNENFKFLENEIERSEIS